MRRLAFLILCSLLFISPCLANDITPGKTIFAQEDTTLPVFPYQVNVNHTDNGDGTITITAISAPTTADYLVGTANGSLSAEIVVGTAPGGELGGTWASPTIDTTHSGSAHHSAITLDANADTLLSLSTQALGLDTQAANTVLAGRVDVGIALVPTFRSLVALDIPALPYEAANANIQAHISDNTQAHSDYMLNSGDTGEGAYTFNGNLTLGNSSAATYTLTSLLSGATDPVLTFANEKITVSNDLEVLGDISVTDITVVTGGTLQLGAEGISGLLKIYSEQGATDYIASLYSNTAMTSAASFYLPADEPAATSLLNMTTGGVIGFDPVAKDLVTTAPLAGGTDNIFPGADSDVTLSIDNISYTLLADGTDGNLITWDANGAPALVATGTATQVLTSNGAGAAPTFQAAAGGSVATDAIWDAAGDLVYGTGADTAARLAAGATTTILVGGGAAAPVWTTATGSGAPVRAGSPTFTTQISTPIIDLTGGQIAFPAAQADSAGANTLDDYEEGTWTATLTCGTSGTVTLTSNTGNYTKIGNRVHCQGYFNVASVSSPVGELRLSLPFAVPSGNAAQKYSAISVDPRALAATATTSITGHTEPGTSYAPINKFAAGAATALAGDVQANSEFRVSIIYCTN